MSIFETISCPLFNGGVFRTDLLAETHYFYCTFNTGSTPKDKVSKVHMQTTGLAAGRVSYHGGPYGINEPAIDKYGLFSCPAFTQLVPYSEDTSNWIGTGPWAQSISIAETGIYTVSTNISGATIDITAGTATIDDAAQAMYGVPDQFEVTSIGTITITSDTVDPKAQITKSSYKLPYAVNTTSSALAIPENFSDVDQGYKFPIEGQLLTALHGTDGTDAQGKLTVKWRPMFNYDQATTNNNIFSFKDDSFTLYSKPDGYIIFSDGTKYPGALVNFQAGIEYIITLQHGPHPGYDNALKMQLTITDVTTTWQSNVVDFDGSFNPVNYLNSFFGAEYPQYFKEISIKKEIGFCV